MKYIYNYILSLFDRSRTKIIIPSNEDIQKIIDKDSYVCEIQFKLTANNDIDIMFLNKSVNDDSVEQISTLAENAANLIVLINNGLLKKELLKVVKEMKKINMNNDKITLLMDNILFFHNLLQEELKSVKKESGPLIRPSNVFRSV